MLTSRQAEVEKRDRLAQKGQDGGSFIPRAVTISGISPDAPTMSIPLPNYINFDNFLGAFIAFRNTDIDDDYWSINFADAGTNPSFSAISYATDDNNIEVTDLITTSKQEKFKLTVFYKG